MGMITNQMLPLKTEENGIFKGPQRVTVSKANKAECCDLTN